MPAWASSAPHVLGSPCLSPLRARGGGPKESRALNCPPDAKLQWVPLAHVVAGPLVRTLAWNPHEHPVTVRETPSL